MPFAAAERIEFIEVFVSASIDALVDRDVKGLYRRALAGEVQHFTWISDPYEEPIDPDVTVRTDAESVQGSAKKIVAAIERRLSESVAA